MKVLITGGACFIESDTYDLLLAQGHEAWILDCLDAQIHRGAEARFPAYLPRALSAFAGMYVRSLIMRFVAGGN
jgi:nucleoside-diphosphate-sugar epimerase